MLLLYSPLNSYLYVHWILDFKSILLLLLYSSRALSDTEHNYGQIEKELLALLYACQKFDSFILGREFTVEPDHKPLE